MVRIHRGVDPDLIVRLPDGLHAAVAMSWTDDAGGPEPLTRVPPLLALARLRQVVQLLDHWRPEPHYDEGSSP